MRALLFETRTGNPIIDLEMTSWDYDTGLLAADALSVTVPGYTPLALRTNLRDLLTPMKHGIALIDDSVMGELIVPAAGPIATITAQEEESGRHVYEVKCVGIEKLLERRHVRLYPGWPLVNSAGKPTGTYDQSFQNVQYGTIIKGLVQESTKFAGGELPLVYEANRSGTRARSAYEAIEGKPVLDAVDDITQLVDGVEYDFQPYLTSAEQVRFRLVTGTDAENVVAPDLGRVFNVGGHQSDVSGWERTPSAADTATEAIFTGGKSEDKVLIARATSSTLTNDGWPRLEVWDSSHSSVSRQATLNAWAQGALQGMTEEVSFQVRQQYAHGMRHGEMVYLAAREHWDMPDGWYPRRVLSVARSHDSADWVQVTLLGVLV